MLLHGIKVHHNYIIPNEMNLLYLLKYVEAQADETSSNEQ